MNKVISRKKLDIPNAKYFGNPVAAATIIRTPTGYEGVLLVQGKDPVTTTGHLSPDAAEEALFSLLDDHVPDFLRDTTVAPNKQPKSRAKAKVTEVDTGTGPRALGSTHYTITGETEGQILYAVRQIKREYPSSGFGTWFGELETINGVLTLKGHRSNNCD